MRRSPCCPWLIVFAFGAAGQSSGEDALHSVLRMESSARHEFDRRAALQSARASDDADSVWWQSGFIRAGGEWQPVETASPLSVKLWGEYRNRRVAAKDSSASQLKLADWCRRNDLHAQEQAHLTRALRLGELSNAAAAYRRLGYRQVGRWWFTNEELQAYQQHERTVARRAAKLAPRLEAISVRLERNPQDREKVQVELANLITDEESLAVVERWFSGRNEAAGLATVDILSRIDSFHSSQALARLAIASGFETVRTAATEPLKQRRWEDFVPMTLEMLYEPVEINIAFVSQDQQRARRFLFQREGRQRIEAAAYSVFDRTEFRSDYQNNPSVGIEAIRMNEDFRRHALDELRSRVAQMDFANDQIELWNQRTGDMLAAVTGQPDTNEPSAWWTWWDNAVDIEQEEKTAIVVSEFVSEFEATPILPPTPRSCLAAGTLVRTAEGFIAIEKIQPGDLVLAKDIETGELAFKPVLETTRRLNVPLTNLIVGDEAIAASPGHNFWICGRGWNRANQLIEVNEPALAHTATGALQISVEPADRTADVFNLVVADFHTYFVGKSMVLGHDVLPPEPTDHRVPGFMPDFGIAK